MIPHDWPSYCVPRASKSLLSPVSLPDIGCKGPFSRRQVLYYVPRASKYARWPAQVRCAAAAVAQAAAGGLPLDMLVGSLVWEPDVVLYEVLNMDYLVDLELSGSSTTLPALLVTICRIWGSMSSTITPV